MKNEVCKVCGSVTSKVFTAIVLRKYNVSYFQCTGCYFIQTEKPFWLNEAYSSAIADLDIGLVYRNEMFTPKVKLLIDLFFNKEPNQRYLDYGGGYGLFVRMMRDRGYDFYRQDIYCENLFAKQYDISNMDEQDMRFDLVTVFEVFEHLENPLEEIKKIVRYSKNILFSTEIQPHTKVNPENWWYFVPQTGQHISIYNELTLQEIAKKINLKYYKISNGLHLFTEKKINLNWFNFFSTKKWALILYEKYFLQKRNTLLFSDFEQLLKQQ